MLAPPELRLLCSYNADNYHRQYRRKGEEPLIKIEL